MSTELESFKKLLVHRAQSLGFASARVAPAEPAAGYERLRKWLEAGMAGQMDYLARRQLAYKHPSGVLPTVRSLVMLTTRYGSDGPPDSTASSPEEPTAWTSNHGGSSNGGDHGIGRGRGNVARYARGARDYHDVIHDRLRQLKQFVHQSYPDAALRGVVDTAPLLEREFAQLAGLGWIGKNTLLLDRQEGSWFFLAALLTDLDLPVDPPMTVDHCGTCRACLDACPTDAFPAPYVLDARRCISYLTIELRGAIPRELRAGVGDWVFGCDVCQEVCPWNRRAPATSDAEFQPQSDVHPLELAALFELDDDAFRRRFRDTALWRARRPGLLRNAAIVLGNQRDATAVPALTRGLGDPEPLVRASCAWALGRVGGSAARAALTARQLVEEDADVMAEIQLALES